MAKQIKFPYKGKQYILEYNRAAAKRVETLGFRVGEIDAKPNVMIPLLFAGAFAMHHPKVIGDQALIDEIFGKIKDRDALLSSLLSMYRETVTSLFEEPEDDEGNISWGMEG